MTAVPPPASRRSIWAYAEGLAPVAIVWLALVGWLAALLYSRANWSEQADEATVREWIDEARNFRKTLPELVREYVRLREDDPTGLLEKRAEIEEHIRGLAEPTRAYLNQLPSFPIIYRLEVEFPPLPGSPEPDRIVWESPLPRPPQQNQTGG